MRRIAIIIGSTRPGRKAEAVAKWVYEIAQKRSDAEFEPHTSCGGIDMSEAKARQIVLAGRPQGKPQLTDFRLEESAIPTPSAGQVLVPDRRATAARSRA